MTAAWLHQSICTTLHFAILEFVALYDGQREKRQVQIIS